MRLYTGGGGGGGGGGVGGRGEGLCEYRCYYLFNISIDLNIMIIYVAVVAAIPSRTL